MHNNWEYPLFTVQTFYWSIWGISIQCIVYPYRIVHVRYVFILREKPMLTGIPKRSTIHIVYYTGVSYAPLLYVRWCCSYLWAFRRMIGIYILASQIQNLSDSFYPLLRIPWVRRKKLALIAQIFSNRVFVLFFWFVIRRFGKEIHVFKNNHNYY